MPETRTLHTKLAEIMAAVGRIEKRGWNDFHKYHYAMEADIVEAVRSELSSRKVTLVPSLVSLEREGTMSTAVMDFTFTDGETGEVVTCRWAGTGDDKGDKGAYKAFTGAYKYLLMKLFLIPTGDDPEADESTDKRAAKAPARDSTTRAKAPPCPACGKTGWVLSTQPPKPPGWFCWKNEEKKKLGCGHQWETAPAPDPAGTAVLAAHRRRFFGQLQRMAVLGIAPGTVLLDSPEGKKARRDIMERPLERDIVDYAEIPEVEWGTLHEDLERRIQAAQRGGPKPAEAASPSPAAGGNL